ncbi:hypothetical protein OP10G_2977 [Fimbriimonas ginsengisoli Gsoil 348]|uniref:Uncharacterized protein n=1 Tax=Fimbriimonas ginsengisoli Gsoil 348 TaxID=661478 RepID=A0A068NU84_FIMGI|nr:hypothetical protein OP10G_2977 [Fimbriimonas ginsengisoli Gsoil 348]
MQCEFRVAAKLQTIENYVDVNGSFMWLKGLWNEKKGSRSSRDDSPGEVF